MSTDRERLGRLCSTVGRDSPNHGYSIVASQLRGDMLHRNLFFKSSLADQAESDLDALSPFRFPIVPDRIITWRAV